MEGAGCGVRDRRWVDARGPRVLSSLPARQRCPSPLPFSLSISRARHARTDMGRAGGKNGGRKARAQGSDGGRPRAVCLIKRARLSTDGCACLRVKEDSRVRGKEWERARGKNSAEGRCFFLLLFFFFVFFHRLPHPPPPPTVVLDRVVKKRKKGVFADDGGKKNKGWGDTRPATLSSLTSCARRRPRRGRAAPSSWCAAP